MPHVTVNGVELHVEVGGEGIPILGLHGTPSSAAMWADAATELARHGRCITYDRRGFLRSRLDGSVAPVGLDDHVDDALALLDALDAVPAIVIGRSTGGLIALELALRSPRSVRALVLLEPAVFTLDEASRTWADGLRRRVLDAESRDPSTVAEFIIRDALGDATWDALPAALRETFAGTNDGTRAELHGEGLDLSARPREFGAAELAALAMPILVVAATDSPDPLRRSAALLADLLPTSETVQVPGGHLIHPADTAVLAFIDRHAAPADA
ncbi:alpha/beta hydrolase [Agromyces sp. H66]|uniref:alpha/beta fold hydrolase n=1 Tax=Agromyces sp. H66 TaxID=2529859 RepID=UPI0010AA2A63|nr:alpha/beta hydrolase [Agromyces sp. H66]